MKLPPLTLAIIALFLPSLAFGNADGLSAEAIRDKVVENNSFGFNNARADVKLTLVSKRNTRRERIIRVDSLDTKEEAYNGSLFETCGCSWNILSVG